MPATPKILVTLELRMDAIDALCMTETTDAELRAYVSHALLKILNTHRSEPCFGKVCVLDVELPKRAKKGGK